MRLTPSQWLCYEDQERRIEPNRYGVPFNYYRNHGKNLRQSISDDVIRNMYFSFYQIFFYFLFFLKFESKQEIMSFVRDFF